MNRETIIQMAREAGFELDETDGYWVSFTHEIEALVAMAVAKEAESRKAAQAENADLKERLARSGIEQRRAVAKEREEMLGRIRHLLIQAENRGAVAEREECAKVCEGMHDEDRPTDYAWAIRARGEAV